MHGSFDILARSEDDHLIAKLRHFLLSPVHHRPHYHHHQQQQQRMMLETNKATEPRRLPLLQAFRCHRAANVLWSAWSSPMMPPSPPLQLLALYRTQIWMSLVSSSLMGADISAASASNVFQTASPRGSRDQQSFDGRPAATQRPAACGGRYTAYDQPLTRSTTDVALVGDDVVRPRNTLVNWLLDSQSRSSTSTSATTAAAKSTATSSASAFDAARRHLEQVQQYRHCCTDIAGDVGRNDIRQRHAHDVVHDGRPTMSGAAVDVRVGDYFCRLCFKRYATSGAMKMHTRTHTRPCRCSVCGKAFSRPWLLQGHIRTHTGERPFACSLCQRAFADRSNLRAHLQTHAAVKKYACSRCGKTFSRMSLLAKHGDGAACARRVPPS